MFSSCVCLAFLWFVVCVLSVIAGFLFLVVSLIGYVWLFLGIFFTKLYLAWSIDSFLREMDAFSGTITRVFFFCSFPYKKVSSLKGKNLLPWGVNSSLFEKIPFSRGLSVQERKQDVTKFVPLFYKRTDVSSPLKFDL